MLALAVKTAGNYGQDYVGSEHLLAGILLEQEGFAARVLARHGITMEWLCQECGWKTAGEIMEERERSEYERLKTKFETPQTPNPNA
jgi:ATP-dependent Clp protease ATP-binding subunit ClpA